MDTVVSSSRRRTQAVKTARVVVPPRDESTGLPDLPRFSGETLGKGFLSISPAAQHFLINYETRNWRSDIPSNLRDAYLECVRLQTISSVYPYCLTNKGIKILQELIDASSQTS